MKKITKSDIKQIKEGNHAVLMDCLDFLLDTYNEDKYDLGYGACLADMSVRSQLLAERLEKESKKRGVKCKGGYMLSQCEVAEIINDYFNEIIKQNG